MERPDRKRRFAAAQIVAVLREADAGIPVKELCRKHKFSDASYSLWRSKRHDVSDAKRLKKRESENTRLKTLRAESLLENEVTRRKLPRPVDAPKVDCSAIRSSHAEVEVQ